ncbi:hypothetical protein, conserved [Trypanosoma brucei gambiense DAL972]|uniref:Uncharacterized protein n=1 Tax=Trypanosoma brucei gambiense (strain MHOM/CI/86/DAL972) TaxID=679716 RepID=C9ZMX1_TRYB9|nr:hypothetical protein, conserved [Trypanosoma brucei gambiense DAL972]CBH10624.1 hypothetical protein, conserved [Trypanosoma brucei gambiense DAL972]|eukprot:XP_011772913.1 hypothetical protein, conserved [Trypanosoma brucei gambiense DAL972]
MMRSVAVIFAAIIFVLAEGRAPEISKDESLTTLQQIDCVVKKLSLMINVTEDLLLRTRVRAEEIYGKRYSAEEKYTMWEGLFVHIKRFMKRENSNEMKEILNEMGSVFEAESYLRKKFEVAVSHLEEKVMNVVSTGIRYAATMEEMYRVGLEAVCIVNSTLNYCGDNSTHVTCDRVFFGKHLSEIVSEFDRGTNEHIDLSFTSGTWQSFGGNKLADKVNTASTSLGLVLRHRGIRSSFGKDNVQTNKFRSVEIVNASDLLKLLITPLREINNIISQIESVPSQLLERASRIDTLSGRLRSIFNNLRVSSI